MHIEIEKKRSRATPLIAVALRRLLLLAVSALVLAAPFVTAGAVKAQVYGIGGYDLASPDDQAFAFDYDSSGKADHLVLYRPGTGTIWILANQNGTFVPVYASVNGIGGYDLKSPYDRIFPLDYNSTGNVDHLVCYRPGAGVIWILANAGGSFTPAFQSTSGIGGFDLMTTGDIGIAYDATTTGKYDSMLFYRPGTNVAYGMRNLGSGFQATYISSYGDVGLGTPGHSFDLSSPADRLATVTIPGNPRVYLIGYRPGAQIATLIFPSSSGFGIGPYSTSGLGGYDLRSPADQLISFDYNSTGLPDHILAYRPGEGIAWILQWVGLATPTSYSPVFQSTFDSKLGYSGIGGFDLSTAADRIISFDYDGSGHADHLLIYRPGTGVVWILQNVAGMFSPVYVSDYLPPGYGAAALSEKTIALGENFTPQ